MPTHTNKRLRRSKASLARSLSIIALSTTAAFIIGIETAGDIDPVVDATEAGGTTISGDMNTDGRVDAQDASIALEIARGLRLPTAAELAADPDQNFSVTMEDVASILDAMHQNVQ